jgi:hypothetical protein
VGLARSSGETKAGRRLRRYRFHRNVATFDDKPGASMDEIVKTSPSESRQRATFRNRRAARKIAQLSLKVEICQ